MKRVKQIIKSILFVRNLPKTLYVNFRVFPLSIAVRLPVYCGPHVTIRGLKRNSIMLDTSCIRRGILRIGLDAFSGTMLGGQKHKHSFIQFGLGAKLVCKGKCSFASGNTIMLGKNAELILGNDFSTNVLCDFFVSRKITFGDDCFCGWNVSVRDGDGHFITDNTDGTILNHPKEITIGSHVWICSDVNIMKGVEIASNSIIACNSLVLKSCDVQNAIYGGSPAKIIKNNIDFIRDGHGYC